MNPRRSADRGFLYTDFYQLTMAQLYFREGIHENTARFEHFFRSYPDYGEHQAGYCVHAGMSWLRQWMKSAQPTEEDLEHLRSETDSEGNQVFSEDFLSWLQESFSFERLRIQTIPEGRVVHPHEPLTVVEGPLAIAQLLETSLLNHINYQTLIATKASRIKQAGLNNLTIEFGMRRAHGPGANSGARGALIGGVDFSSNTGVSYRLGFPPKGTHAHSMVQAFMGLGGTEKEAFEAYADLYPENCLLLVDTVDTLESGIPNAIRVFESLREKGHQPLGIRLDSGDLAHLAVRSAKKLNEAGFEDVSIVLSNQLNELVITQIIDQIRDEAPEYGLSPERVVDRLVYGVGTRLITSKGDPALGGVYKLVGIQSGQEWKPALKVSESPAKIPNPGRKHVFRIYDDRNKATADLLTEKGENPQDWETVQLHHPTERGATRLLNRNQISRFEALWEEVEPSEAPEDDPQLLENARERRVNDLSYLDSGVRRILNPHYYHVSLSRTLWNRKRTLISEARESSP